ncbi:MAG: hypothetical protein JOZ82_11640, partial [Marmoricola sp.]|nr:hypothetical protein [Marmoricola sp.]
MRAYEELLGPEPQHVVLVLDPTAAETAVAFAERYPGALVHLLSMDRLPKAVRKAFPANVRHRTCWRVEGRIDYVAGIPAPELVVEGGNNNKGQKRETFRALFPFLADGGWYAVEDIDSVDDPANDDVEGENVVELLQRLPTLPAWHTPPERATMRTASAVTDTDELAHAASRIDLSGRLALVQRRGERPPVKLRDATASDILKRRLGRGSWGEVVDDRPEHEYAPRATFTMNKP